MQAGMQYTFTIDLANSSTTGGGIQPGCAECQIWGSNNGCHKGELLWASGNITPYDVWQTHTVTFIPTQNWPYITIYVNSLGCTNGPYILVDNMTPLIPATVNVTATVNNHVSCAGGSNGMITAAVTGQNPPFTYQWSTTPAQTTSVLNNVTAGSYTVTVTDANTCTATAQVTVTQPQPLTLTPTVNPATCFGTGTGSAYMSYAGGTAPMTFNWANGTTTQNNSGLFAGTVNITVTDANSCSVTGAAVITEPTAVTVTGNVTNPTCGGITDGSITASASGGTPPYASYQWNTTPPQNAATATNVGSGTYTVTVTDANTCTASASFNVSPPPVGGTLTLTPTHILCYGENTGAATCTVNGGSPPFTYQWNTVPPQSSQSITNLLAGSYTVTVTDVNTCSSSASVTLTEPSAPLAATVNVVDVLCYGNATGSATVTAAGGTPAYSYQWNTNPVQTTNTAVNLAAANYNVLVTDANNCTVAVASVIAQPAAPLSLITTSTDVLCYGDATGSAGVTASGGTPNYTYLWSTQPPQNTAAVSLLSSNNYQVTVTDANNCTTTAAAFVAQPAAPLSAAAAPVNVSCNGMSNGSISVTASGGTPSYAYQWSTTPTTNTASVTNLAPGTYAVTITDNNSCTFALSNIAVTEPSLLTINPQVTDVSCPNHGDGSIATNASGGVVPYTYQWNNNATTSINNNIGGGAYSVTVTDNNGCTTTGNFTVNELPGVSVSGIPVNVLCYPLQNGYITLSATSSFMPLQYLWSNGASSQNISSLDTGQYTVTVIDAHNCTATASFHIGNDSIFSIDATPEEVTIDMGQSTTLNVAAIGSAFGTVEWTPPYSLSCTDCVAPDAFPLESVTYYVTGTDVNGCVATDAVRVNVIPKYVVFIPNAFTPNGDGANDYFEVFGNKEAWKQFNVQIFNRIGEKIFESNNMHFKWDGTYKGVVQNPAVFIYQIRVVFIDNHVEELFKGSVTILR